MLPDSRELIIEVTEQRVGGIYKPLSTDNYLSSFSLFFPFFFVIFPLLFVLRFPCQGHAQQQQNVRSTMIRVPPPASKFTLWTSRRGLA